jgi:anaerobic dimethyl sulfoxide reductase subunit B (iron-sulfur subunit)
MQKCDFCLDRWAQGKKPICVNACLTRALDAGPADELEEKYGNKKEAAGFTYVAEIAPSIIFKPKTV